MEIDRSIFHHENPTWSTNYYVVDIHNFKFGNIQYVNRTDFLSAFSTKKFYNKTTILIDKIQYHHHLIKCHGKLYGYIGD